MDEKNASPKMIKYFENMKKTISELYNIATKAREQNLDPEPKVEIALAENMAERVIGLISVLAPQIASSGAVERIKELETQYGSLDWRVALKIAEEIAFEKFCKFKTKEEAIDIGIRTGFAYSTVGVVSSPLDGLVKIEIKKRLDNAGEYFCLHFAGPIRNAGGTNAAFCTIIADYVRKKMKYSTYDATEEEAMRAVTELEDYHERVTNLQYVPSKEEIIYMVKHLPIEISGDPSEDIEVSNHKDLPRIPTNKIRSGYCLLLSSCIPLKAPKLWKQLSKWGTEFELQDWNFLEEFLKIQKASKAHGTTKKEGKITPDYTYISDLVAGRPVFGHPLEKGGFRLRYGRARCSGYSAQAVHPATMQVLDKFLAIGTQLKCERPGKGAVYTPCDTIEGPIVKLKSGEVIMLDNITKAKEAEKEVQEIIFLGDVLINYGDFFNRAHILAPPGYCEEWWALELEKTSVTMFGTIDHYKISETTGINTETIQKILENPLTTIPTYQEASKISKNMKIPLHPRYTYHYNDVTTEQLTQLRKWIMTGQNTHPGETTKIIIPYNEEQKRTLELIGTPHKCALKEFIIIEKDHAEAIKECLKTEDEKIQTQQTQQTPLEWINNISPITIRDKSGIYIGARMGRPEKAKMRKMTGSPHGLFPVGPEGGRLRSLTEAIRTGTITAEFSIYNCPKCGEETVYPTCHKCETKTTRAYTCTGCGKTTQKNTCQAHGPCTLYAKRKINALKYFEQALKKTKLPLPPDLIKGVRGTFNDDHYPENMIKSILRAKHEIHVNKDGTIRYDCSETPLTHAKPKEIGTTIEKLKELGYATDAKGEPLTNENQIIELYPQDVVLPSCPDSPNETSDNILIGTCNFIDDLLENMYGLKKQYNVKKREDLIGQIIIALAPHTSAGLACRIIGFSKTQGFFAHPYVHAACRRDCDGDEIGFILLLDALINFSRKYLPSSRGSSMDAPLVLTSILTPTEVDDMAFDVDIVWKYPLEFYEACQAYKMPWDVKIRQIKNTLNTTEQYERMGYTHETTNINEGILCSAYKTLPSMEEKLKGQMNIATKIRAVNAPDVARLVIEKHFIRDTKGNLRKFTTQEFRCVNCNEIYRRPPLQGTCTECKGKIIFTVSEGSVTKYFEPTHSLAKKYGASKYLLQTIELLKLRIEGVFGKDKEKQAGLGAWFG